MFYLLQSKESTFISADSAPIINFALKVPESSEEQTTIAQILSDLDGEIEVLEKKRDKNKTLKQRMMRELLTGRIRLV